MVPSIIQPCHPFLCAGEDLNLHALRHMALNTWPSLGRLISMVYGSGEICAAGFNETGGSPNPVTVYRVASELFATAYI